MFAVDSNVFNLVDEAKPWGKAINIAAKLSFYPLAGLVIQHLVPAANLKMEDFLIFALVASVAKRRFEQEEWFYVSLPAALVGEWACEVIGRPVHRPAVFSLWILGQAVNQLYDYLKNKP